MHRKSKIPAVPYTRPMTKDRFFRKSEYVYDEYLVHNSSILIAKSPSQDIPKRALSTS